MDNGKLSWKIAAQKLLNSGIALYTFARLALFKHFSVVWSVLLVTFFNTSASIGAYSRNSSA